MQYRRLLMLIVLLTILATATLAQASGLADSAWPMFHGNSKLTGQSIYDTSKVTNTPLWEYDAGTGIEASPTIGVDGSVYIADQNCNLTALDPHNGTVKWQYSLGKPVSSKEWNDLSCAQTGASVAADGTIYILPMTGNLFAINADGTEKWRYPIFIYKNAWSSPAIGPDGTIYVGSESYPPRETGRPEEKTAHIYAINPDGTEKWSYDTNSNWSTSTPSIADDGTIYTSAGECVNTCHNVLLAFNPNGTVKWRFAPPKGVIEGSIAIGPDGGLYFAAKGEEDPREAFFYAVDQNGNEKWKISLNQGASATAGITQNGTVYFGDWGGIFYAVDIDGNILWKYETPSAYEAISSSPAIGSEGTIYFGTNAGIFFALNPDGSEKWRYEFKGGGMSAAPAISSDGIVYAATVPGKVLAFGTPTQNSGGGILANRSVSGYLWLTFAIIITALIAWRIYQKRERFPIYIEYIKIHKLYFVAGVAVLVVIGGLWFVMAKRSPATDPCPHHVYGTETNGYYGAFEMKTRDLTDQDIDWIQSNCTNTTWPEQMR